MKMIRSLLLALSCGAPALLGCGGGETVLGSSVGPQPVTLARTSGGERHRRRRDQRLLVDHLRRRDEGPDRRSADPSQIATVGGRALTVGATGVYCIGDAGAFARSRWTEALRRCSASGMGKASPRGASP